ncbi:response regulator [Lachnospiraceae bacterium 29-84]
MGEKQEASGIAPQVLIVDDIDTNCMILAQITQDMGCSPRCATSAGEAAALISESLPQLILLDVFMPEMDGYEFCGRLKESPVTRDIPIIFISAADSSEDKVRGLKLGAVDYIGKPFEVAEVTMRVNNHLKIYHMQQELESLNRQLHSVINSQTRRMEEEQKNMLYALSSMAEGQGDPLAGHLDRTAHNCRILAQSLQFSPEFSEHISESFIHTIEVAVRLRDIGNLREPCSPSKLWEPGAENSRLLQRHVDQGTAFLEQMYACVPGNSFLPMAVEIAQCCHAYWDGSGYPRGIAGKQIPLSARIATLVDFLSAVAMPQGERPACGKEAALEKISKGSGTLFDPEIVDVFLKVERQMLWYN